MLMPFLDSKRQTAKRIRYLNVSAKRLILKTFDV